MSNFLKSKKSSITKANQSTAASSLISQSSLKILVLVHKPKSSIAPKYLRDHIRSLHTGDSHRLLSTFDRHVLCSASLNPYGLS